MAPGPVPIRQTAQILRDVGRAVAAAYSTFGAASDAPEIRYWHGLDAPFDCNDVCWIIDRGLALAPITNADVAGNCLQIADQIVAIQVARCWPGGVPNPEKEAAAVEQLARDATVLWWGIGTAWGDRSLFPDYPGLDCETVRFGTMSPIPPGADRAGWSWPLTVRIGYTVLSE